MTRKSLLSHAPRFDPEAAAELARELYGWQVQAQPLPGERDQNFLLLDRARMSASPGTNEKGEATRRVLKVANGTEQRQQLEMQQAAMQHLASQDVPVPQVLSNRDGESLGTARDEDREHLVWAISWLPGRPLGSMPRRTERLLADFGQRIAEMDLALADFDHPGLHRDFHWDLRQAPALVKDALADLPAEGIGPTATELFARIQRHTLPLLPELARAPIHNDLNDYNVLVSEEGDLWHRRQTVAGFLDFGDMVHSYRVADLAIAIAYALLDQPEPLSVATTMAGSFHRRLALSEEELGALWGLVCLRLLQSACHAARQQRERPEDPYLSISQAPIRRTLPRLMTIPFALAEAGLRSACGLNAWASSDSRAIQDSRRAGSSQAWEPLLSIDLRRVAGGELAEWDLGVASPQRAVPGADPVVLQGASPQPPALTPFGQTRLPSTLPRPWPATAVASVAKQKVASETEPATVHLGRELLLPSGTDVRAPATGTIRRVTNARDRFLTNPEAPEPAALESEGPWDLEIELSAATESEHCSSLLLLSGIETSALADLQPGHPVKAGQFLGKVAEGDGGHRLRVQLMHCPPQLEGPIPAIVPWSQAELWMQLCVDPAPLLGISAPPSTTPSKGHTLSSRHQRIGPSLSLAYREPVQIVRGWQQYLWDERGHPYLDAYNNVPHVGHAHPRVVEAVHRQLSVLNTNTRYLHENLVRYAEALTRTMPDGLEVCFFLNSASEANELALRLARHASGGRDMLVLEAAYHGHTSALVDLSPYKHDGPGGEGAPDWVHVAPMPDLFRGEFRYDHPQPGPAYARRLAEVVDSVTAQGRQLAGFIAETCPSVGGQHLLPEGYLEEAYAAVRRAGGLCIADEVQTGLGRIGTHLWAFQAHDVVPDIVVLGKPIGNGHPLAAVITSREIADRFANGMEFFSTFGGNTVSCAAGLAVLETVLEEGLMQHAHEVGQRLLEGLRGMMQRYPLVGDVRGSGLFLGVELVDDPHSLAPAAEAAAYVSNRLRELGILIGTDGLDHNVLKIRPPMPFDRDNADLLLSCLDSILAEELS